MTLIFDTETTGLARFDLPPSAPEQPRLVQLGLILCDDGLNVVSEACFLVHCNHPIEDGAFRAHGKTNEMCMSQGIRPHSAIGAFVSCLNEAKLLVGHNLKFDKLVINAALCQLNMPFLVDKLPEYCTMLESSPILRLPNKSGRGGYKWPKLEEAYSYFFPDQPKVQGAHNALVDCHTTLAIYKKLLELKEDKVLADAGFTK